MQEHKQQKHNGKNPPTQHDSTQPSHSKKNHAKKQASHTDQPKATQNGEQQHLSNNHEQPHVLYGSLADAALNNPQQYVTVSKLSQGFSEFALAPTTEWIGQSIRLHTQKGLDIEIHCLDRCSCAVELIDSNQQHYSFSTQINILMIREHLFFLDLIIPAHVLPIAQAVSLSVVFNTLKSIATIVWGELPTPSEYELSTFYRASKNLPISAVKVEFLHASLNKDWQDAQAQHAETDHLIGHRIKFRYSENDLYQHRYLNHNFYTWECLKGIEAGLCETDRCFYFAVGEQMYLFVWIEKIIPTLGAVILDLNAKRSHGKIFGYAGYESGQVCNFMVGSYVEDMD
ncbi:molybdenum cofactor biosynthesis protein F [Acinetobacter calcoaceticus]|uniref:Molybdenum cofactor biosynthesis protein F n=1 Tax=Acinetobacter calcoaceticus TaxID=471 RepID=A0A4R1Y7V9_ACICA|nr:molybdenum cofactor biosynthesis protein F [Acinetobacter calcoaceticus]